MKLNNEGIQNRAAWERVGVTLPSFDWQTMCAATAKAPRWVHFGAGNIFRGFIASLQQSLLNQGLETSGIIAADTFDFDIINQMYEPHDSMTLLVSLRPDGGTDRAVVASIAKGVRANTAEPAAFEQLVEAFENPSLQMVSFTITEKGYPLTNLQGGLLPVVEADLAQGPQKARHAMSVVAALLLRRYRANAAPLALVSMDNCSHNGEKLRASVLAIARGWVENGFAEEAFLAYVSDENRCSFPWTMIDKITPRPDLQVAQSLAQDGIEGMEPVLTAHKTYIAAFVNAELPQYLVVEDRFPNGRPALEKAGVYMTDRATVNNTERMKVTTCLNPLHTALAVYGCLLGYPSIASEMRDPQLKRLVEHIGYDEGMPVVVNPGIIRPLDFIHEVIDCRLPNPFIPDVPQRIATDTSQKISVRFGETIKAYLASDTLHVDALTYIPLAIAGWLRYLLGVDDTGAEMTVSPDPMLAELQAAFHGVRLGDPASCGDCLRPILQNPVLFGVDLYKAGLGHKIEGMFCELIAAPGAVRATLIKYC
ncbi:MAG: mannitol dehydrogenase family protein [Clostridia bacterium]